MLYKDFPIIESKCASVAQRDLIYGVGINDANYVTQPRLNGVKIYCPIYLKWKSMFERSYSSRYHNMYPTYIGCSVDEQWHSFMAFREWVLSQPEWEGLELDKDLLMPGNKVYGPDTCVFVHRSVNLFLTFKRNTNSGLPIGVVSNRKRYVAMCSNLSNGIYKSHTVTTPEEASKLYWEKKFELAHELAAQQVNDKVAKAIIENIRRNASELL